MTEQMPWLLIDVGNTAIKWRLANAEVLLDAGNSASDVSSLCEAVEAERWGVAGLASVAGDAADAELIAALTASGARAVHKEGELAPVVDLVRPTVQMRPVARTGAARVVAELDHGRQHERAVPAVALDERGQRAGGGGGRLHRADVLDVVGRRVARRLRQVALGLA